MKRPFLILICLLLSFGLRGCLPPSFSNPVNSSDQKNSTQTLRSIISDTLSPSSTVTLSPVLTYTKRERDTFLQKMISEPIDCAAPCFLGITTGETTSEEVQNILKYYGLETYVVNNEGKEAINFGYDFPNGLNISAILPIRNNVIETITVNLTPNHPKVGAWQGWGAYSPISLISKYGPPTQVEFASSHGPTTFFSMIMYFQRENLIIEYYAQSVENLEKNGIQLCPLEISYNFAKFWMGDNPLYPPGKAISLDKVSSLTLSEFSDLLEDDPGKACFEINADALFN